MKRTEPRSTAPGDRVERLVKGELRDPHGLLGRHPDGDGEAVVRAWRPEAETVAIMIEGEVVAKLDKVHEQGLFEGHVEDATSDYFLEVTYPGGQSFTLRDPYSFLPTLGDVDLHLAGEGSHRKLYEKLGAHVRTERGVTGVGFAVWAPNARSVRVVGDFNSWDGRIHPMRSLGSSGVWELFIPDVGEGAYYKFEVVSAQGSLILKSDPYAFQTEEPPGTACRVHQPHYRFTDEEWVARREASDPQASPLSVYEVHLGSWRRHEDGSSLTYREMAPLLADYCTDMGFTHVEMLPVAEHPFGGSWGYQVSNYFAPTARYGTPDDFRFLVDTLHKAGIGVIVDWVPAHFPKDEWALARFDGTGLYEHSDPRKGEHPDWGTLVFNYGRNEVRNFLIANALYWIDELHIDGLRVDAVASMLYLDYSRKEGEWVPNPFGGRENLEAISFMKELNTVVHDSRPGVLMIAEESTAWPGVSRPVHLGGLGFGFKWNMGWMHDTLAYFSKDAIYRRFHHNQLTFSMMYAWSENFMLPLSHDEVVHGKGSLLRKMPGDKWQKLANLRSLFAYMWAHPGKQLVFMGGEIGQEREWDHDGSVDWHLLEDPGHDGVRRLVADLNRVYRESPALWERDSVPETFQWIDANDADNNVFSFYRTGSKTDEHLVCIANMAPVPRTGFRVGLPKKGRYEEVINSDAAVYGGSGTGNMGSVVAEPEPWHGLPYSALMTLPPLGVVWLRV
ncbi:MAG TPA: 1,4-alpha-glucan branching protein GlgB [Actinomycetota bacterium]|nr:1,4-alpha-glucan branching protein GlgB [Actinomycetota bacterium]